jgi:8-oxo-dGTP diphosphatase
MNDPQMVSIVAGCVLIKDGKYLLVQEKKPSAYGQWNLPAGKVDTGESIDAAAVREVREETGYDVVLGDEISVEHTSSASSVLHAFSATITGGELHIQQEELLDAQWFSRDEVEALDRAGKIRVSWAARVIRLLS